MSFESSREIVRNWILKHACKFYMTPVVKNVLFGKNDSQTSSNVNSQLLSQAVPGNAAQIQPLLALMFLRSVISNLKSPSVHEDVALLRTFIDILEQLTFCFNDNSVKFVICICHSVKIMIVLQYIRSSNPATIKVLNDYFPMWSMEYENKLKTDFKINEPSIMRKLRNNNETSRKFLLSFLLKKRNLTSEIYRTFAERDLATVSQSLYKQFIILWFEIIESLPSTEIEQIMNSKWTFDSTDDPAILILLECLRLNDKIVPTTAAVEKALLMALELLDKDVAPGSISEMFILNHLSGSYEPPTIPSSSPIVPVSDTHDKESSEVQAENCVNCPSPDLFLERLDKSTSQKINSHLQEVIELNVIDDVQNKDLDEFNMQVDTEKDDGCIILSSESDSSSSNMNPPSTDKSSVQNCTTCESIDTCDTNSHSKKLEQPCDRKSPNHTTSSRMNIDSVNESSGRKLSLRTHSHTLDSTHASLPCLENFLISGDVTPCLIKLYKIKTFIKNEVSYDIYA